MMAANPLPVRELYVPTANVAPVGMTEEMLEAWFAATPTQDPAYGAMIADVRSL